LGQNTQGFDGVLCSVIFGKALASAVPQADKGVNWVFLRANLEMKPKFNDPDHPGREAGNQHHGWQGCSKEDFLSGSRLRNNAFL